MKHLSPVKYILFYLYFCTPYLKLDVLCGYLQEKIGGGTKFAPSNFHYIPILTLNFYEQKSAKIRIIDLYLKLLFKSEEN